LVGTFKMRATFGGVTLLGGTSVQSCSSPVRLHDAHATVETTASKTKCRLRDDIKFESGICIESGSNVTH